MSDSFYKHSLPLLCKVLMYAFYLGGREDCFEICTMLWFSEPAKCCQENQDWEMWLSFSRDHGLPFRYVSCKFFFLHVHLWSYYFRGAGICDLILLRIFTGCLNGGGQIKPKPGQSAKQMIPLLQAAYADNVSIFNYSLWTLLPIWSSSISFGILCDRELKNISLVLGS